MKFHKFTFISSSHTDKECFNSRKRRKEFKHRIGPFIVLKYQYGRHDVVGKRSMLPTLKVTNSQLACELSW